MKIIEKIQTLKKCLSAEKQAGKSVGFVPTMGALHDGHLSLVRQCMAENDVCVVSIFVNPAQFNDPRDLAAYPRTPEKDCVLLEEAGCDYVFAPEVQEMYPAGTDERVFNLGSVAEVMEGVFRPGHFDGVARIVSKLFEAVEPDRAYFGEKDFQQIAVIKRMVSQLNLPVQIIACPIVREADGLAMSSRNTRLTPEQRQIAPIIAATLKESRTFVPAKSVQEVKNWVINTLNMKPLLRVEYYEIVDGGSLVPLRRWDDSKEPVGCIAVFCGEVRLIDNVKYALRP
ncbi:MAG: pantoate--beta-alanine ligase [Tannerella sp.]|jgi:pantoate--beta-alanine ligase|nr:pantoate--beta-alanine ligase [Tannerella sp.]